MFTRGYLQINEEEEEKADDSPRYGGVEVHDGD